MAGVINHRPAGSIAGGAAGAGPVAPSSMVNSFRVTAVAARLAMHMAGQRNNPEEFFQLCLALARGIDYAVANNEVPARAQELPIILKQVYQRKNMFALQAVIMVLMISVKNACKRGWFLGKDSEELLTLANEVGSIFCSSGDLNIEPSCAFSTISKIMSRFYPRMKMGCILASLEVKPGYGALVTDFHIPKNTVTTAQEKIRLFVAQTDNIDTSSCIINPPQVSFLLNGKGVERRTNVSMDNGPQYPTNVTSMLKYGANLLQVIGHFNWNYIIVIAFMSVTSSSDTPKLHDYVQPAVAALYSDSDIIEGPSRISLNCPISHRRIKMPVKGHLCKHHQCFDYDNYMEINSRRPSWRCPHCNQSVCYPDIRIDQNMVKVLREVGEGVSDVIISSDGSWKAIFESDDHMHQPLIGNLSCLNDGSEHCESARFSNTLADVVDLTVGDDENYAMDACETEDRKPFRDSIQGYSIATNVIVPPEVSSTAEVVQNVAPPIEDDFWEGIFLPTSASYASATSSTRLNVNLDGGISESTTTNFMLSPVLTDAVSPALNREPGDVTGATQPTISLPQSQFSAPCNSQLQLSQFGNSLIGSETGRSSITRNVTRTPIAIQALPAQTQVPNSQQRQRMNLSPLIPNGAPPAVSHSPMVTDSFNGIGDIERQQQFLRSLMNPLPTSDMASSSMQHQSMIQNWDHQEAPYFPTQSRQQVVGLPATSQFAGAYRSSSQFSMENHNLHQQQPPNLRLPQTMTQTPSLVQPSTHFPQMQVQQGAQEGIGQAAGSATNQHDRFMALWTAHMGRSPPAVPVQLQAPRTGSSLPLMADGLRASMGEQRGGNMGGMVQPVPRADGLVELPLEQNWRPAGRMRGSLTGRASAAFSQFMIQPTQPAQAPRPLPDQTPAIAGSSQLQVHIANSMNAHGPPPQTYPRTGSLGILATRSVGMH